MYDLTAFNLQDMTACGAALRRLEANADSMEEVANRTVRYLYEQLVDDQGKRANALVRFFITRPYRELNDELRQHVDRFLGKAPVDLEMPVLDGIAAIEGIMAEWPAARILVLTSFATDDRVSPAVKARRARWDICSRIRGRRR